MIDNEKVQANISAATDEDLLDRVTVYREGMEPWALALAEAELRQRGIGLDEQERHEAERRQALVFDATGLPVKCERCGRPAAEQRWSVHRLWGLLPLFPRRVALCNE